MEEYVLLIMSCQKYKHKALLQKQTWLKTLPDTIQWYHVIGNPDLSESYINEEEHILYVNTKDDYVSLPKKVITSFEYISNKFTNLKYIFKTDDDQQLLIPDFFNTICNKLNHTIYHYGGFPVNVNTHISKYYTVHKELPKHLILEKCVYCNGRFYFLSNSAIKDLVFKKPLIQHRIIEDHAIGRYLHPRFKLKIVAFDTKKIFKDTT